MLKFLKSRSTKSHGFALPMAMGLGLVMLTLGLTAVMVSQNGLTSARQRRGTEVSLSVAEGGIARVLAHLTHRNNVILLHRNYDTLNPKTGKTYLGADGVPNSGDETNTGVDQWSGYDPSGAPCYPLKGVGAPTLMTTGTMGAGSFTIRAYRYDSLRGVGHLLIEGNQGERSTAILVSLSVKPDLEDFPGVLLRYVAGAPHIGVLGLRGRNILGSKGNVYFSSSSSPDSSLTGISAPGDSDRPSYLNAVWSNNVDDGATGDTISGDLTGCELYAWLPSRTKGTNFGVIDSDTTFTGSGGTVPTLYQVEQIDLANNETLTVDTTNGPVHIDFVNTGLDPQFSLTLRNTAKILNVRTDGQEPRVGDLRMMGEGNHLVRLYDQSCIQGAFLWIPSDELQLLTSGPGCPGGKNTNFEGVVWAEAVVSAKNNASNRNISYFGRGVMEPNAEYDALVIPGNTSGIAVSEDVSSLVDVLKYIDDWPAHYRVKDVLNWQRVQL
ncbi:MAG: hypothetical protein WA902_12270 [Thermosynechococcaceae cyanobacterium]